VISSFQAGPLFFRRVADYYIIDTAWGDFSDNALEHILNSAAVEVMSNPHDL
jgi:hypothetical protein